MNAQRPHRRYNPLLDEWVLVSPQRTARPWQGSVEPPPPAAPAFDPACYLCPGNPRAHGERNPDYSGVFVFDNDFPALLVPEVPSDDADYEQAGSLLHARPEVGRCRVVCYSPRHDLTLPRLSLPVLTQVVETWIAEAACLAAQPDIAAVTVFENRGAMMGASNPHPHGQIWATSSVPTLQAREAASLAAHFGRTGSCLLCDVLHEEYARGERLICENDAFAALVPYWAVWPFEVLLLAKRHAAGFDALDAPARVGLADILLRLGARFDNLFQTPFPLSWGFHLPPVGDAHPEHHLHAHFYPPLLRSATVRKFMVGFEMLAEPQRDLTPEQAADRLRAVSDRL